MGWGPICDARVEYRTRGLQILAYINVLCSRDYILG